MTPVKLRMIFSIYSEDEEISYIKETVLIDESPLLRSIGSPTMLYPNSFKTLRQSLKTYSSLTTKLTFSCKILTLTLDKPLLTLVVKPFFIFASQLVQLIPDNCKE